LESSGQVPGYQDGYSWYFYDLDLEVTKHHAHGTLLIKAIINIKPCSRRKDRDPNS
jgi:hypothetical protein